MDPVEQNARLNAAFARMFESSPELRKLVDGLTPKSRTFPQGFRYRYYRAKKRGRAREWWCCWSTTRNENGRFVSWVYEWRGREGRITRLVEHRRRSAARARANRLHSSRFQKAPSHPTVS